MGAVPGNALQARNKAIEMQGHPNRTTLSWDQPGTIIRVLDSGYFANGGEWSPAALYVYGRYLASMRSLSVAATGVLIAEIDVPDRDSKTDPLFCVLQHPDGSGSGMAGNGEYLKGRPVSVKASHAGYSLVAHVISPGTAITDSVTATTIPSIGAII